MPMNELLEEISFQKPVLSMESRNILDAIEEPVVLVKAENRMIAYINPAAARLFKLPVEELLNHECHGATCPADRGKCPILDLGGEIDHSEREIIVSGARVKVIKTARKIVLDGRGYLLETINALPGQYKDLPKTVRKSEIFHSFFRNNVKMLLLLDQETGRILESNRAAADFYGYPLEDGYPLEEMKELTLNDLRSLPCQYQVCRSMVEGSRERETHLLASGSLKRVEMATGLIEWYDTKNIYCIIDDVTEIEENLHSLDESRRRYESLFAHSHTPMILSEPGTGEIIDANAAAVVFYGYSQKEFRSMKISDLNPLSPDQIEQERDLPHDEKRNYCLLLHRLASGEMRTVEVYAGPIPVNGRQLRYSIVHDVTFRITAEKLLAERTDQLDQLFDNAPMAIHQCGPDGRLVRVNASSQKLLGYTPGEMIGRRSYEILLPPEKHEQGKSVTKRIQEGKHLTFEGTRRRKDGTTVDVSFMGFPF